MGKVVAAETDTGPLRLEEQQTRGRERGHHRRRKQALVMKCDQILFARNLEQNKAKQKKQKIQTCIVRPRVNAAFVSNLSKTKSKQKTKSKE
jgi:hypothetical protein